MTKLLDPELLVTLSPQFLNPIAQTHNEKRSIASASSNAGLVFCFL